MNRPFFLQYDIPTTRNRPVCDNPSNELWAAGCIRITYSCWLVMENDMPELLLNRLTRAGVRWHSAPFDVSGMEALREMALENVRREVSELVERARITREEANTRLDDESDTDYRRRRSRYIAMARSIEKRVGEMLTRVKYAAERFGINPENFGMSEALEAVELIGSNMRERAEAFAEAHSLLTRTHGRNHAITKGLREKTLPAVVAADFLNDQETAESVAAGDKLRSSFGW